jgi:hypothetical protein
VGILLEFWSGRTGYAYGLRDAMSIDGSEIVWARDMGSEKNRESLAYYLGRQFWMVHAGSSSPRLKPSRESATDAAY